MNQPRIIAPIKRRRRPHAGEVAFWIFLGGLVVFALVDLMRIPSAAEPPPAYIHLAFTDEKPACPDGYGVPIFDMGDEFYTCEIEPKH